MSRADAPFDAGASKNAPDLTPDLKPGGSGPTFCEPWEAHAFAIVLQLHARWLFEWAEWAGMLAAEIRLAEAADGPDTGAAYYHHWLSALEKLIIKKGLTDASALKRRQQALSEAARRTPHGEPIKLHPHDLS